MKEFKRARSAEQKSQRMADIKDVTAQLFAKNPYHSITLTTIAEELGWSRANLYKYVTTKEEIFLELACDARDGYLDALKTLFDSQNALDIDVLSTGWARVCHEHRDWAVYGGILMSIIETNVTVERLKVFKKGWYDKVADVHESFKRLHDIDAQRFHDLIVIVQNQAIGINNSCASNPLVVQALEELGIERRKPDFLASMTDFIRMCLSYYLVR